ncbi:D-alanyl-D-alanine carboxypeptidase family protein [Cohnella sp. CBP 2801]|uniref:D-alanyl-D-alanine carboxypeptidase family protein n=2 Tax=Cohnella zeiphila TaxID=2761120 RepID=A0A7X0SKP9_9BACL|nr:D-alanyl-D-alanine carboxypeptidase family protein [Cohnella zeiphila]
MADRGSRLEPADTGGGAVLPLKREGMYEGELVLVNREHPVRVPPRNLAPVPELYLRTDRPEEPRIRLERACLSQLVALLRECRAGGRISVVSGYRSREAQEKLYADSLRENGAAFTASYVALPGASEHQTGLAVDVGLAGEDTDYIRPDFPDNGVCADFRRLAAQFGFVQRYREEKTPITGIACEPWHYRYVGFPHSAIMEREGLCLEEYTEYVKVHAGGSSRLVYENREARFEIGYVAAAGDRTNVPVPEAVPEDCRRLSGNNKDGFVVTTAFPAGRSDRHGR